MHQMSNWENTVESDLMVNKRMFEKTKKDKIKLADEKKEMVSFIIISLFVLKYKFNLFQDMIVYRLMTEVWKLESELETIDMQLRVKDEERERLAEFVAHSNTDIEALQTEHRCLLHSWNSVIAAITARDKNYAILSKDLNAINENIQAVITEIGQVKKLSKKEMLKNEHLTMFKNRVENDLKNCQYLMEQEDKKREELESKIYNIDAIIEITEKNYQRVYVENCKKDREIMILTRDFEKLMAEKGDLEEKILKALEDQLTNDKAATYLNKVARQVKDKNRDMEITLANTENLNAKVLMEIEEQKFLNEELDRLLAELLKQQAVIDKEINDYVKELDRLHFLMGRKERDFDLLNSKYEKLREKMNLVEESPYEQKIKDLEKEIEDSQQKSRELQKFWLREQENMVILTQQRQEQMKDLNLIRKQTMILEQRNLKIGDELEALKKQDDKMSRNISNLITKQISLQETLNNRKGNKNVMCKDNVITQSEFIGKLKDAELEALQIEAQIEDMEEDKVNLSTELIEKNREALSWEKKIQMATETRQEIKKEQSQEGEIGVMKSEIHRMNVRFSQLKKAQDKLIQDLEHCISRREAIYMGAESREKRFGLSKQPKKKFSRNLDDIKNGIKKIEMEMEQVDRDIEAAQIEELKIKSEMEVIIGNMDLINQKIQNIKLEIQKAKTDKLQVIYLRTQHTHTHTY